MVNSKKVLFLIFIVGALSACGSPSDEQKEINSRFEGMGGQSIIIDKETGCKYLFTKEDRGGGLSPLYNEKGELYCGK